MKLTFRAVSIALILAGSVLAVGCNKEGASKQAQSAQQQMPPTVVDVQVVELTNVPLMQSFAGRVVAIETSEVRPQVGGIVDEVLFKEGSYVKKGQELYRINRDNYVSSANTSLAAIANAEASLVSAKSSVTAQESNLASQLANLESQEATLAQARADLARVENLVGIDAVSKQVYDQAKTAVKTAQANVKTAQASVRTAQANIDSAKANVKQAEASINSAKASHDASRLDMHRTVVRAPISGKISISAVTAGALVSASQANALATISRTDAVFVDIQQSSSELLKLRQQFASGKASHGTAQVQIILEDGQPYPLVGQLALADAKVDQSTGAITLRAVFPNPDGVLIPGMYVNANLIQAVASNAVLLPQSAVTRTPKGETQVYVVNADKKIEVRTVKTAGTFDGKWVVTDGLNNGDSVVVVGGSKVKADQVVEARVLPAGGQSAGDNAQAQAPQAEQPATDQQSQASEEQASQQAPANQGQNSVIAPAQAQGDKSSQSTDKSEAEAMADDVEPQGK